MTDLDAGSASNHRVMVVDDDPELRTLVNDALVQHGFDVTEVSDGSRALELIRSRPPDLVILDLGLPGVNGLDVLRQVRAAGNLPVIVLTGRSDEADRVVGLEMGADDYVVKPFSPRELAARVGTVLRRTAAASTTPVIEEQLVFGDLVLDRSCRDVRVAGALVELTAKEFDLLAFLVSSPRQVFSREQLIRQVWSSQPEWQASGTVAEHIHRLRRKIEPDPSSPRWIQTMRGAGYRFTP